MHSGHRDRLRQRFVKSGLKSFAIHEKLELILFGIVPRKDVNPIAHELIAKFGSLRNVMEASVSSLESVNGVGETTAIQLHAIASFYKEMELEGYMKKMQFINLSQIGPFAISLLKGEGNELLYAIFLDSKQRLIDYELICEGSHNEVNVNVRKIVKLSLDYKAAFVILCHNHPGGTLKASNADIESTKAVVKALADIGISLVDHIIVADRQALSMDREVTYSAPNTQMQEGSALSAPERLIKEFAELEFEEMQIVIDQISDTINGIIELSVED